MKRHIRLWARLLSFRINWPSRRVRGPAVRGRSQHRVGRLRRQWISPDLQPLEPKLALAAAVGTKVTAITAPVAGSYNAGDELVFQVRFSGPVQVTGQPVVNLTIGKTSLPATYVGGTGTNTLAFKHVVAAGENDADGIAVAKSIVLPTAAALVDGSNKAVALGLTAVNTAKVAVDTTAPAVASVTVPAAKTYAAGAVLSFTVNFTEKVVVSGTPVLPIEIGSSVRNAVWNGKGSGTKSLTFTTTVQSGDSDSNGIRIAGPVGLTGAAAIRDAAQNDVNPDTTAAAAAATKLLAKVTVDAVGPSLTVLGTPEINAKTKAVGLAVTFSEPVTVKGKPSIPFTLAGNKRQLT